MKVLNNLSIKDLKLNKKRSTVIIIGIILSTALICGVAGILTSFQHTLIEFEKDRSGVYHAEFLDVPKEELKYIEENRNVKDYCLSEDLGYASLEGSKNENKPYLNLVGVNDKTIKDLSIKTVEGRLPENSSEIAISQAIKTNAKVDKYKVGDTLTLDICKRISENGTELTQADPFNEEIAEKLESKYTKTFTIVGIIERPSVGLEQSTAPGYTLLTKMESIQEKANIAVEYTNIFKYQENTETINQMVRTENDQEKEQGTTFDGMNDATYKSYKYKIQLNSDLLAYEGANLSGSAMTMIYWLAGIIIAIILVSSIFVIRNGFAISITERLKQYGMLSSIGATKKQIKKSVYFEGLVLGGIGIPLGILSGVLAIVVLLKLVNYILRDFINGMELTYSISWIAIIASAVIAVITIWLSCRSSARKASKVTPIEAIRSADDVKLKAKKIKCPKIITKIFKTGGEIAYKNLKRSKRKYRTTVISIIVSVVIFITISSFIEYGFKMSETYYTNVGYNVTVIDLTTNDLSSKYNRLQEMAQLDGVNEYSIQRSNSLYLENEDYYSDFNKELKKAEKSNTNSVSVEKNNSEDEKDSLLIMAIGKEEYQRFVKKIGGNYESYKDGAILIDSCFSYDSNNKKIQGNLYTWQKGDTITGKINDKEQQIKVMAKTEERPMGLENTYGSYGYLIVSDEYIEDMGYLNVQELVIKSDDSYKVEKEIEQYMESKKLTENDVIVGNIDEAVRANNAMVLVISIFLYGFIAVITAIGITNIFNTITTNMNLRRKEFAMLKSVGMTKKEFNRMIRLESIFYGAKSLIIGIPIGVGLSYAVYRAFETNMGMVYQLPIKAIVISMVFVAVIVGVIMRYSMFKINKQNIIETIRNDNI